MKMYIFQGLTELKGCDVLIKSVAAEHNSPIPLKYRMWYTRELMLMLLPSKCISKMLLLFLKIGVSLACPTPVVQVHFTLHGLCIGNAN